MAPIVVGGGLTGLLAALAVAGKGFPVTLIASKNTTHDGRTTAVLRPGVQLLRELGLWSELEEKSAPLRTMRLVDMTGSIVRAPTVEFSAAEMDLDAFGYNIPNAIAVKAMTHAIETSGWIDWIDAQATDCRQMGDGVEVMLAEAAPVRGSLVLACDGRASLMRKSAGIGTTAWSYPQTAVVTTFGHTLPHHGVSTELHTATGPFTQVPLPDGPGNTARSSLVWSVRPEEVSSLQDCSENELSAMIERKLHSMLGKIIVEAPLQAFSIGGLTARRFASDRILLLGEAAHVFPPIGAQGFNLGIADILAARDLLEISVADIGARYHQRRAADIRVRTLGIDLLNRSLLPSFLPYQAARSVLLGAMGAFTPLRRALMATGMHRSLLQR